ncbi:MAG TPA: nitroreductase family deazaflavin-dependent oxidoreductase [Candidatus Dormibacteraeota bacterium]
MTDSKTGFSEAVLAAAARLPEVELTTYGRKTGKPHRTTIWVWGDGRRLFIRSGAGMGRDWPQNLLANGRALLHLGDLEVPVAPRHVTDFAEARALHPLVARKYGEAARRSIGDGPLTPAEQATFELLPAADAAS